MVTKEKIEEAAALVDAHLGPGLFNADGMYGALLIAILLCEGKQWK